MEEYVSLVEMVEQDLRNAWNMLTQEIGYVQLQIGHLFGITPNAPNPTLNNAATQTGGVSSSSTSTAQEAAPVSPTNSNAKPPGSIKPEAGGTGGFLWDPTNGTNASIATNWDYNGQSQVGVANPKKPGDTGDPVWFDPQLTQQPGLHGNGDSSIIWDYSPKYTFAMQLGGSSTYDNVQEIEPSCKVDASVGSVSV